MGGQHHSRCCPVARADQDGHQRADDRGVGADRNLRAVAAPARRDSQAQMSNWLIGRPGFRVMFGPDWCADRGYVLEVLWRERETAPQGEYRYHFTLSIGWGRSRNHVLDFGGPWWCPWVSWHRPWHDFGRPAYPSASWTGRHCEITGIEWPFRANLTRVA